MLLHLNNVTTGKASSKCVCVCAPCMHGHSSCPPHRYTSVLQTMMDSSRSCLSVPFSHFLLPVGHSTALRGVRDAITPPRQDALNTGRSTAFALRQALLQKERERISRHEIVTPAGELRSSSHQPYVVYLVHICTSYLVHT